MALTPLTILVGSLIFWTLTIILANLVDTSRFGIFISPLLLLIKGGWMTDFAYNIGIKFEPIFKRIKKPIDIFGFAFFLAVPMTLIVNLFVKAPMFSTMVITALTIDNLVIFLIALFIALLIHELFHAIVAVAAGENIESFGIGIVGIVLVAFTQFPKQENPLKKKKVARTIIFAGAIGNLLLIGLLTPIAINADALMQTTFEKENGALVISIDPFGPANNAKMTKGTVILSAGLYNGLFIVQETQIVNHYDLINFLHTIEAGSRIKLYTNRGEYDIITKRDPIFTNGSSIGATVYYNYKPKIPFFSPSTPFYLILFIHWMINVNLMLAAYNMLPIPFTDGERLLQMLIRDARKRKIIMVATAILFLASLLRTFPTI